MGGHVARMGFEMHTQLWSQDMKGTDQLKRPKRRWEHNIKKELG
jgi:hypothetical protein